MEVTVKWGGKEYKISGLGDTDTVLDLKNSIYKETGVLPDRQKLLGLKFKGKPPDDEVQLVLLKLRPNAKIMMMGTREEELQKVVEPPEDIPDVVNDFDFEEDVIAIERREEYLNKIERRVKEYEIKILHEPRPGKKLLVLDIDYTIFDHKSSAETGTELMRPFLHEFMASAYNDYDIVIWSATSMKWIEAKMQELDCITQPNYKISFYMDSMAMITIDTGVDKYGVIEVKPLGVIWGKYPQWGPHNTIMFDDLRRNFLMNPKNGLKIRPFRAAHFNRDKDRELVYLSRYLKDIASVEDFATLNHRKWEKYKPEKKEKSVQSSSQGASSSGDA